MILSRVLLAPFITIMLVCGTLVYYFATYSRDQIEANLLRVASDHLSLIEQFLDERVSDLKFASASHSLNQVSEEAVLAELFRHLAQESRAFFDLGVFDESGNHLAYVGPYDLAGKNYSDTEWFKTVKQKGLYISDEFLGYRNIPHFIIAVSREEQGKNWYLRATIDTLSFNELVEGIRIGKTGEAYLVNRKGVLQTRRRSGGNLMEPDPDFKNYLISEDRVSSFMARGVPDEHYLYAAGPLDNTDWVLVVRQDRADAYKALTHAALVAIALIIGGGGIVVLMAYILASSLSDQLTLADIEKKQMKTQLIIAGKLAEVGEMSAGVAHEINNPLQVMMSEHLMIEDLIRDIEQGKTGTDRQSLDLIKDSVDQVGVQIERCKHITQGLLRFARKDEASLKPIKLQEFLPEMVDMIEQRAQLENIRLIQEFDPDLPLLVSDPNQLQQVFLNLLNNAIHALQGIQGAEIRIKALRENEHICVSVADNGCGIAPGDMEKIFHPFFTTKPPGQGTGLGLSSAYGIVKGLKGEIFVSSELDAGTVFTVNLPINYQNHAKGT